MAQPVSALRVLGDRDITPLTGRYFPQYFDTYRAIRIPAAKAGVARASRALRVGRPLCGLPLRSRGCGRAERLIGRLGEFEAIFVDAV
jgi:hypothetical protein